MPHWNPSCLNECNSALFDCCLCHMHPNHILNNSFIWLNAYSCSSANKAANTCAESNSSGFCQHSGFLMVDIDIEWLFNVPPGSFVSLFFTSFPLPCSFPPPLPGGLPPGPCGKLTCVIISTSLNEFTPQQVSWDDQQLLFMVTGGFSLTLVHATGTTGIGETWLFMYVDRLWKSARLQQPQRPVRTITASPADTKALKVVLAQAYMLVSHNRICSKTQTFSICGYMYTV